MDDQTTSPATALLRGLGIVYLPQLVGAAASPLLECSHCVGLFAKLFLIVPGGAAMILMPTHTAFALVAAATVTLGLIAGATVLARRTTTLRIAACAVLGLCSAANAWALCQMLRA